MALTNHTILVLQMAAVQTNKQKTDTACLLYRSAAKPIIFVCVAYSQAPDRPFPLAIMEALSVVDYFLTSSNTSTSSRKIHIDGISAGGNLALVAALETHRRCARTGSHALSFGRLHELL
jgi:acetyl esterase/lipase